MPYDIERDDVYRTPLGRYARVMRVEGALATLAYIADPSPLAEPARDGDGVTLRADFLAGCDGSLPMQYPCRRVARGPV